MMTVASHSPSHCADPCSSAEELLVSRLGSFNNWRVLLIMHAMCCWQVAYVAEHVKQICFVRTRSWLVGPAHYYKHFDLIYMTFWPRLAGGGINTEHRAHG